MRKKIVGMVAIIAILAMLYTQAAAAPTIIVNAWTDKAIYHPGEKGKLKISMLNLEENDAIEIYNITIIYPWWVYDAKEGKWMGNETKEGDTRILETVGSKGSEDDHYYLEAPFTVPSDGRAHSGSIYIGIWMSDPTNTEYRYTTSASLSVPAPEPRSLVGLDTWMTSLIVAIVICTIILAIVVILSKRGASPSRALVSRAPAPPPPPKT